MIIILLFNNNLINLFYLFIYHLKLRVNSCLQRNPVPLCAQWSVSVKEGSGLALAGCRERAQRMDAAGTDYGTNNSAAARGSLCVLLIRLECGLSTDASNTG